MNPREAWALLQELAAARTAADDSPYLGWQWQLVTQPLEALGRAGIEPTGELMDPEAPFVGGGVALLDARLARWQALAAGGLGAQVVAKALTEERGQALLAEAQRGVFFPVGQLAGWWPPQAALWAEGYWLAWCWAQAPGEATGFEVVALVQAGRALGLQVPSCLVWAAGQAQMHTRAGAELAREAA